MNIVLILVLSLNFLECFSFFTIIDNKDDGELSGHVSPGARSNHVFSEQVALFDAEASYWWNEGGPFDLLHAMNPLRLKFIQDCVGDVRGLNILDVGCGGGILAEPLARLGAKVTGIDASGGAIKAAKNHSEMMGLSINYIQTTVEELSASREGANAGFDLVIASEIIEHVPNPPSFLKACQKLLCVNQDGEPNNHGIIVSTLNRTPQSFLGAIVAAEYVLRWVPRGTHEWQRFLKPSDIADMVREMKMEWHDLRGLQLNPLTWQWSFSKDLSINYIGRLQV